MNTDTILGGKRSPANIALKRTKMSRTNTFGRRRCLDGRPSEALIKLIHVGFQGAATLGNAVTPGFTHGLSRLMKPSPLHLAGLGLVVALFTWVWVRDYGLFFMIPVAVGPWHRRVSTDRCGRHPH